MKDLIKKILNEEISSLLRRRLNFDIIEKSLNKNKIAAFRKNEPPRNSILATIQQALYDIMPNGFEDDDTEYYKVWDEIKQFLKDNYTESLTQYFEKRQKDLEQDTNELDFRYIFVKHDKPYNQNWSGFADGFDSYDEMLTKYGNWVDVDWDQIKLKLDDIKLFPFGDSGYRANSIPLRISNIGDEGNKWGYNFSVIKSIPQNNLDEFNLIKSTK